MEIETIEEKPEDSVLNWWKKNWATVLVVGLLVWFLWDHVMQCSNVIDKQRQTIQVQQQVIEKQQQVIKELQEKKKPWF